MQQPKYNSLAIVKQKIALKEQLKIKYTLKGSGELMTAKFGYEDTMVATGFDNGYVRIFNMNTKNKITEIDTNKNVKESGPVNAIRWRPISQTMQLLSSVILVANTNGHLYQYIAKTGKQIFHACEEDNFIMAIDYSSDAKYFATGGKDTVIRIYDQETKKISQELKGEQWRKTGHNNRLFALKFKTDENDIVVSGGWDQNINVWDRRTGQTVSTMYGPKITGDALDIRDNMILSGANRGNDQLQLWDWRKQETLSTFVWDSQHRQNNAFLCSCQFCGNSTNTVLAAGGQQMKIFALDNSAEMLEMCLLTEDNLYTCDASSTNNKYIAGSKNGQLFYLTT